MSLMRKARSERAKDASTDAYPIPRSCGCDGCDEPVGIVFVIVRDQHARERVGAAGQFGKGSEEGFVPASGFTFVGFVARCARHYMRDIYANGKGHLAEFTHVRQQVLGGGS